MKSENKKKLINYANFAGILVVLALVVFVFFSLRHFSEKVAAETPDFPTGPLYFNEIMTNNSSYPDKRGIVCDWAELFNSSSEDIDIGGYIVCDGQKKDKLIIPDGTIIKSDDYLMISFGGGDGDLTAPFSLSKNGNETLILCDMNDTIVDAVEIERLKEDTVMAKDGAGKWIVGMDATPMYKNDVEKYFAYIEEEKTKRALIITEVMSRNLGRILDGSGNASDWIEITNYNEIQVNLSDYYISDDGGDPYKFRLPDKELKPGDCIIVFAVGAQDDTDSETNAGFKISSEGETLYLNSWRGIVFDKVEVPYMPANYSFSRLEDGAFVITHRQTPGRDNSFYSQSLSGYKNLEISEVCPSNRSGIRDGDGDWSDWIELKNAGGADINLGDLWLSADSENVYSYKLPDITLPAGGCIIIYASDKNGHSDEPHANFRLSSYGEIITLYTNDGCLVDSFEYKDAQDDISFIKGEDESASFSEYITPGYENTFDGHIKYMQSLPAESPLIINEVMTSNSKYISSGFGEYYDWIELKNNSQSGINLNNYSISDNSAFPTICVLPDMVLPPGETFLIVCSGDSSKTDEEMFHADFVLSAEYSALYLFDSEGIAVDCLTLSNIPPDRSYGRMPGENGFYYFEKPTPGGENADGFNGVTKAPVPSLEGGAYKTDDTKIEVELVAEGDIYYTLDGRTPHLGSQKYDRPIEISGTAVIRAFAIAPDKLRSCVTTAGYFVNAEHELPILSLSVNPKDMFDDEIGIYVKGNSEEGNYYKDWEKQANLTLYDTQGDGFSIDCGLKMHGGGSRRSDYKKSMKVIFRPKYGQGSLNYDLFGENTPDEFTSLVLRAGEDYRYTVFRSELVSGLAKQANPDALTQAHKYCVLYVNGEYFGIYALMERYNEEYYAARYYVPPESVSVVDAGEYKGTEFQELIDFCKSNKMNIKENYEYICGKVDIDLLIDWCVFQAFSGNTDIPFNVRVIKSSEGDGKWRYCFYDLDWTMRKSRPTFDTVFSRTYDIFAIPKRLMANEEFQKKLIIRMDELRGGVLSDENVLAEIERLYEHLRSELPRDRQRWHIPISVYEDRLEMLRKVVRENDRWAYLIESLTKYITIDFN